jgi:hypothetical protein
MAGSPVVSTASRIMTTRVSGVFSSTAVAAVTYGCARAADALVFSVVRPPRGEILLVSDVILATAFGVAVYLWLHLRATRTRLTDLERDQVVVDTQLTLAAQIQHHLLPPRRTLVRSTSHAFSSGSTARTTR